MPERKKILIADDDTDLVQMLRDRLEHAGFETLATFEGVRTIDVAHKKKPDLILLDLNMPAGKGQSVLESLRSRPDTRDMPVIILTAMSDPSLRGQLLSAGAQDFIEKPYDEKVLIEKIRSLLNL